MKTSLSIKLKNIVKFTFLLGVCMCLTTACDNADANDAETSQLVNVKVTLSDLEITQTRATATEAKVTNVTFKAIDANNVVQATVTQASTDTDFGTLSLKLPVGDYKFVAVANSTTTEATITSATEASIGQTDNVNMYSAVKDVTIEGNSSQSVTMEMGKRKNTLFLLKITDDTPSDVQSIQIVISPSASTATSLVFNPTTGLASSIIRCEHSVSKSIYSDATFKGHTLGDAFLLTAAEQKVDVTINALSSTDEVLYTRTLKDVTFKQSESTTATGTFFSSATTGSFTFDTAVTNNDISLD